MELEFSQQIFFKNLVKYQISWKPVQWEPSCSLRTDGRTGRHDEANSRFTAILRTRLVAWNLVSCLRLCPARCRQLPRARFPFLCPLATSGDSQFRSSIQRCWFAVRPSGSHSKWTNRSVSATSAWYSLRKPPDAFSSILKTRVTSVSGL